MLFSEGSYIQLVDNFILVLTERLIFFTFIEIVG